MLLRAAIDRFDALNAADPHGKELLYARRMTQWLEKLEPGASETLQLAARSQHLMRWQIPRDTFPKHRAGYLKWRTDLKRFHAAKSAEILTAVGYDAATIARVRSLNLKEDLGRDPETQVLEDALCLVTLEHQLSELLAKTGRALPSRSTRASIAFSIVR